MEQNHLCSFGRGHKEEHFCEITLNSLSGLGHVVISFLLSRALVAPLFGGAEPFVQF